MTFLILLLDICFYNFTPLKTNLFLLMLLNKKEKFLPYLFVGVILEIFLKTYGRFFIIWLLLYFLNQKIKICPSFFEVFIRFLQLYIIYLILVYFLFGKFVFQISGLLVNLLFVTISYKNEKKS